ncbi:transcription factor IIIA-like isoform X1 [Senna tora]|uniref:Transcription factor IIIA-like isoform X1 n=1 Tax=Senna tora TaxID=362788 RepID=A0A834TNF8_9FABA|nr:transcription factor IIIA-like isoform X1 [Senna tora]
MLTPALDNTLAIAAHGFVGMYEIKMDDVGDAVERPIFRDIRRYYCEYCGICRSKKTLITAHINTHHKDEVEKSRVDRDCEADVKSNTCKECGASFKKPAYLLQHMQSHSLEVGRPPEKLHQGASFTPCSMRLAVCSPVSCSCQSTIEASYRRKDHLNRHLLQHQGKTFKCPIENCNRDFAFQGNMTRHVKEFHNDDSTSTSEESQKQYVCPEIGFKLDSVEVVCLEPDCMKHFSNVQCLQEHIKSCHQYVTCETCGKKQLKKNIKRHLRMHETEGSSKEFKCEYEGCGCTFSSKSNLQKHVKAVHFEDKPFVCGFPDCGMRFSYKHVRDNHEKTAAHVYTPGDFEEADDQFRSRPRGGRKRKYPTVEMLIRKRVTPPSQFDQWFVMNEDE